MELENIQMSHLQLEQQLEMHLNLELKKLQINKGIIVILVNKVTKWVRLIPIINMYQEMVVHLSCPLCPFQAEPKKLQDLIMTIENNTDKGID